MPQKKNSLTDFRPQERNANAHTPRGMGALLESMSSLGWAGAITAAADGEIIDGSARIETAFTKFGETEPIVVEIDGHRPVIVRRTDIPNASHPKARELAIAANRVAELNLSWDTDVLLEIGEEIDLSSYFFDGEIELLAGEEEQSGEGQEDEPLSFNQGFDNGQHPLAIVLEEDEFEQWQQAKEMLGLKKDTKAFMVMLTDYLEKNL